MQEGIPVFYVIQFVYFYFYVPASGTHWLVWIQSL